MSARAISRIHALAQHARDLFVGKASTADTRAALDAVVTAAEHELRDLAVPPDERYARKPRYSGAPCAAITPGAGPLPAAVVETRGEPAPFTTLPASTAQAETALPPEPPAAADAGAAPTAEVIPLVRPSDRPEAG